MPRIRTIKPSFWSSEKLGRCSTLARLNFVGLISQADDDGRGRGETRYLLGALHAYSPQISEQDFEAANAELQSNHFVAFYIIEECHYYAIVGWQKHQYINKPRTSDLPPVPPDHVMYPLFFPDASGKLPVRLPDAYRNDSCPPTIWNGMEWKGMEGNGMEGKTTVPPVDLMQIWHIAGEHHGKRIQDLPADYCTWALQHLTSLGDEYKQALKARIQQKNQEGTSMSKKPKIHPAKDILNG